MKHDSRGSRETSPSVPSSHRGYLASTISENNASYEQRRLVTPPAVDICGTNANYLKQALEFVFPGTCSDPPTC